MLFNLELYYIFLIFAFFADYLLGHKTAVMETYSVVGEVDEKQEIFSVPLMNY